MEVRHSPELDALAEESHAARDRGDDRWFEQLAANGRLYMAGTAPGEVARGREEIFRPELSIKAMNEEFASSGMRLEYGAVESYEAGDAGYSISEIRFVFEDGSYVPARSVTMLAREGGAWQVIGSLISVLAPNELLAPGSPLAVRAEVGAMH